MKNIEHLFVKIILPAFLMGCILLVGNSCKNKVVPKIVSKKVIWDASNEHKVHNFCPSDSNLQLSQSPINIEGDTTNAASFGITFNYDSTRTEIINKGTTLEFEYDAKGSIQVNGKTYLLGQFHTHTRSEHHLKGDSFDMEIHFVHTDTSSQWNNLAVVGVFVKAQIGAINPLLDSFSRHLPSTGDTTFLKNLTYSPLQLMPTNKSYYTYHGSLTAHDCTPSVTWVVMKNILFATPEQIEAFKKLEGINNRPIQSLSRRTVEYHRDISK
jgi:carbonic anhydrase